MKERSKRIIYGSAIASMITMVLLYLCGFQQLSGYVAFIAIPTCVVAVIVERRDNVKGAVVVMSLAMMFAFPTSAYATGFHATTVYQANGSVGWIRPDAWGSMAIDTTARLLTATWDFPEATVLPWVAVYFPNIDSYVQISDNTGNVYYLNYVQNGSLPRTNTISFPYSNENTWVRIKMRMCYILVAPPIVLMYPEINLQIYLGGTPTLGLRRHCGSGGCFMK